MGSPRFSILLVTYQLDELKVLCSMIKRQFPFFYIAKSEEEAIKIITEKQIDVLILGLESLQASESFYLHLLSAKKQIDKILFRKIVLCAKEELKEAFNICSKDVFDDYYLVRPLYDPYHLLIRLRFIRRIREQSRHPVSSQLSVTELCNYFDMVANSQDQLDDLNTESFKQLVSIVSSSMKQMKQTISNTPVHDIHKIGDIIDSHTDQHLIKDVSEHQASVNEKTKAVMRDVTELATLKKQKALHTNTASAEEAIDHDCNILILEDDVISRDHIKASMESAGYKPQVSGSATHAMKLMQSWSPDIVLVDLTLPDMSPLFVISSIKQNLEMSHTRIMVLAKAGDKENAEEAMKLGIHEIMRKPIDKDLLVYKIKYNLEQVKIAKQHH